ncbi:MAG: GAF domain-containing sensor histidine kinase [Aeromicrobium sp.]
MSNRSSGAALLGWFLCALILGVGGPLVVIGGVRTDRLTDSILTLTLLALPVCGALVINQRPEQPIGWLLLGSGSALILSSLVADGRLAALGAGPRSAWLAWSSDVCWPLGFPVLLAFGPLLFPDGLPTRRWGPVVGMGAVGLLAAILGAALSPWDAHTHAGLDHPFVTSQSAPLAQSGYLVGQVLVLATACAGLVAGVMRYRHGTDLVKAQLRLLLVVAFASLSWFLALHVAGILSDLPRAVEELSPVLVLVGFPVAIVVALVRHRVFDLDLIVNRAAVALFMVILLGAGYVAIIGGLSWSVSSQWSWLPGTLAAVAVAIAFQPLLRKLQERVGRTIRGNSTDRFQVLSDFEAETDRGITPQHLTQQLADVAARTVRSPNVDVILSDGTVASAGRKRSLPSHDIPLISRGEQIGTLSVRARSATERYTELDVELLNSLGRQASTAIRLARLAEELGRAQERAAAELLAERERLRRDLHDELGPRLAGVTYLLHALTPVVPPAETALLDQASAELRDAIEDVRRLAHDLRPSVLEEHGLRNALSRHADLMAAASDLDITIISGEVPQLSVRVETALYRIALEALSNVGRHSEATRCWIVLDTVDDCVILEVRDDGTGLAVPRGSGLGFTSMNARASDLGGTFEVLGQGGTTVRVQVPLHA